MANFCSKKPQGVSRAERKALPSSSGCGGTSSPSLLSPKHNIRVGCWNVRSLGNPMRQNSRLRAVIRSMAEKRIQLLALSEMRWPGHGVSQIGKSVIAYFGLADKTLSHIAEMWR